MTERKELIERLRDATEGPRMLINEAADMLEADVTKTNFGNMPIVPQEPVAYLAYDEDGTYVDLKENKVLRYCSPGTVAIPLFAAPQPQPRLTDAEIKAIEHETDMKSSIGDWSNCFARAIEAKVRGEG